MAANTVEFSPDGTTALAVFIPLGGEATLLTYELNPISVTHRQIPGGVGLFTYNTDQSLVISGDFGGGVRFQDGSDLSLIQRIEAHEGQVFDLDLSPSGTLVVSAGDDGVRVWNVGGSLAPHRSWIRRAEHPVRAVPRRPAHTPRAQRWLIGDRCASRRAGPHRDREGQGDQSIHRDRMRHISPRSMPNDTRPAPGLQLVRRSPFRSRGSVLGAPQLHLVMDIDKVWRFVGETSRSLRSRKNSGSFYGFLGLGLPRSAVVGLHENPGASSRKSIASRAFKPKAFLRCKP